MAEASYRQGIAKAHEDIEVLLEGGGVLRRLDENVVLADLGTRADTLFGLLTFSGYLKAEKRVLDPDDEPHYLLSIPNREVRGVFALGKNLRKTGVTVWVEKAPQKVRS